MRPARVIGAGLSGLATAWYLAEAGVQVHVVEAGLAPGGLIQTRHVAEGLVETAARAFSWTSRVDALFRALSVEPCRARRQSARRYVYRGRPRRWPLTPIETAGTAMRLTRAWASRGLGPRGNESVAAWGVRVFGRPATTWLVAPVLQGIYAAPPDALSAHAIAGAATGRGRRLVSPRAGMGELIDRLHEVLLARGVTFEFGAAAASIDPSVPTAVCTSAPPAARLLAPHAPRLAAALQRIRMVSLVAATAFFEPHPDDLRGFGVLFPRSCGIRALGVLFDAEIFSGRSRLRAETWIYGGLSAAALPSGAAAVRAQVETDRAMFACRVAGPVACFAIPRLHALPLYDGAVVEAIDRLDDLPPSIALAGNYLGRLGVSALLEAAAAAAARLA